MVAVGLEERDERQVRERGGYEEQISKLPAERETLDWDSINKLAAENTDFAHFLRDVRIDLDGKKVHPAEYDKFEADVDKLKASMAFAQKQ